MSFTVKGFNKRMQDPEYRKHVFKGIHSKTIKLKYNLEHPVHEVTKMALKLEQETKEKSDLTEEELQILTKIVNDKYSIGAFSGMVFNAVMQYPDECPKKIIEKAVRTRKLVQDMAYQ